MQLHQFASVQENWIKNTKETARPSRHELHVVEPSSDSLDDESSEVLTAEFVWPSKAKSLTVMRWSRLIKNGKTILNTRLM
jgi:hypothetical protein